MYVGKCGCSNVYTCFAFLPTFIVYVSFVVFYIEERLCVVTREMWWGFVEKSHSCTFEFLLLLYFLPLYCVLNIRGNFNLYNNVIIVISVIISFAKQTTL